MGHERLGALPHSIRWRSVVKKIAGGSATSSAATSIAATTLHNVRKRFTRLADDESAQAALQFIIAVPRSAHADNPQTTLLARYGYAVDGVPTALTLARAFSTSQSHSDSPETADLTSKAVAATFAQFSRSQRFTQPELFSATPWDNWKRVDNAAGFCELARLFLANLTERYLRSFLDREASAVLGDPIALQAFRDNLHDSITLVSTHAFETSKIAQSFAAGWFNKSATEVVPTRQVIRPFLSFALHKIGEELRREAGE